MKDNTGTATNTTNHTYQIYGGAHMLTRASIDKTGASNRSVSYIFDLTGSGVNRIETSSTPGDYDPYDQFGSPYTELPDPGDPTPSPTLLTTHNWSTWLTFGGQQMAEAGTNVDLGLGFAASIDFRETAEEGDPSTGRGIQFSTGVDRINTFSTGGAGGNYTVQAGDTLQGVASRLWGDGDLWWKLAETNGLSAGAQLNAGQVLVIPAGVTRNTYNASTFQAHNPAEVIGNTRPDTPVLPAEQAGSGGAGKMLMVIVAVAVATIVTAGAAGVFAGHTFGAGVSAFAQGASVGQIAGGATVATIEAGTVIAANVGKAIAAGAIGGAAGSIASQGVGVATGTIDRFSWNDVARSAISGGVGAGVGSQLELDDLSVTQAGAVRGATSSVIGQGISMAVGLQSRFDWAGVAAASASSAVSARLGEKYNMSDMLHDGEIGKYIGTSMAVGAAASVASAATRSLIDGSDFGDTLVSSLPDVIGSTIGEMIARGACFVADTPIHTPTGLKPIQDIRVGDWVYARNDRFDGDTSVHRRQVLELYQYKDRTTLSLTVMDGARQETIQATPEHPFAVLGRDDRALSHAQVRDGVELPESLRRLVEAPGAGPIPAAQLDVLDSTDFMWVKAGDLCPGDRLVLNSERIATVKSLTPDDGTRTVYNFGVDTDHTYFVGETGVWAHNLCQESPTGNSWLDPLIGRSADPTNIENFDVPDPIRDTGEALRVATGNAEEVIDGVINYDGFAQYRDTPELRAMVGAINESLASVDTIMDLYEAGDFEALAIETRAIGAVKAYLDGFDDLGSAVITSDAFQRRVDALYHYAHSDVTAQMGEDWLATAGAFGEGTVLGTWEFGADTLAGLWQVISNPWETGVGITVAGVNYGIRLGTGQTSVPATIQAGLVSAYADFQIEFSEAYFTEGVGAAVTVASTASTQAAWEIAGVVGGPAAARAVATHGPRIAASVTARTGRAGAMVGRAFDSASDYAAGLIDRVNQSRAAVVRIPPRVQSRIDLWNGNNNREGWNHVEYQHLNPARAQTKSQWSLSREELRTLLQERPVVESPVRALDPDRYGKMRYLREVEVGSPIGHLSLNRGGHAVTQMTIITDGHGRLLSAFPGRLDIP